MVGFVDDSNGQTNLFSRDESENTRQTIIAQLKNNAQLWAELLGVTGGALELSKCSYHVLAWRFTVTGAPTLVTDSSRIQRCKRYGSSEPAKTKSSTIYLHMRPIRPWDITKIQPVPNVSNTDN
jgi:hypothetical protein